MLKRPRVWDSGDTPGAPNPGGVSQGFKPRFGRIAGAPVLSAEDLVPGGRRKVPTALVGFVPIGADAAVDPQRHAEARGCFHDSRHGSPDLVHLALGHLDD